MSFLAASFGRLPAPEYADRRTILARHRDKAVLKGLLARLCLEEPAIAEALDQAVAELNENMDALDDFLNQQNYRLAYWKTADQQLGYRRFFDVTTLIGLRVEREHVFEETHALVLDWLRRGVLDGVRIDHPDGLRDPVEYFRRLREHAPDAWIVGEKILEPGEFLRESWPIEGTSGYDFLNVALGVLVSPEGMKELNEIYEEFTGEPTNFCCDCAREEDRGDAGGAGQRCEPADFAAGGDLRSEPRPARLHPGGDAARDSRGGRMLCGLPELRGADARRDYRGGPRRRLRVRWNARSRSGRTLARGCSIFCASVLTLQVKGKQESEFLLRFQQFTPPVMAKGVEDTAFYCYNRLVAMCEVGGDPGSNGLSVAEFHAYNAKMQATHPHTMTTLSTHDTKRSDDVRARLAVLSEMPAKFGGALNRWSRMNNELRAELFGGRYGDMPDRNTEYLLYQTLIGAWPITVERVQEYMLKAVREAKQQTSWTANNAEFEDALHKFIEAVMWHAEFVTDLERFVDEVKDAGRVNSLAQTLMKHTAPGVPDLYQGAELWDLSLVDPDNRRPVDYRLRARSCCGRSSSCPRPRRRPRRCGARTRDCPSCGRSTRRFACGASGRRALAQQAAYTPLQVEGPKAEHVIAYLRGEDVATVVPRLVALMGSMRLRGEWQQTVVELPQGRWTNRLTGAQVAGGEVAMEEALRDFPVALLVRGVEGWRGDGTMHEFAVWAPKAKKVAVKVGDRVHAMEGPDERGWWKASGGGCGAGVGLRLPAGRRSGGLSRSAQRVAAEWGAWIVARVRPGGVCVAR